MNAREMTKEYRMTQWTQLIQERNEKGETIKEFCERRGISRSSYLYWLRQLRKSACEQLSVRPSGTMNACEKPTTVPAGWAICESVETAATEQKSMSVEIGNCRIIVDMDTDSELLAKVCKVLIALLVLVSL